MGRPLGGENGNPLQYSSLVNPMDRGAWWAMAHGVTNSRTRLSTCARAHTHTHTCTHTHVHAHTCVCAQRCVCTHMHVHTCVHACVHTYIRVCTHRHTCMCAHRDAHTHVCMRMHTHIHTYACARTHYVPSLQLFHPDLISAQGHENYSPIFQMRTLRHRELTWTYRGRDDNNNSCG